MLQRDGLVIPLRVIAHHRSRVQHTVRPFAINGGAHRGVQVVADHHVNRHAVAIGVVNRHRRMLEPHGAMRKHAQRLALNLRVAVGHRHRLLFMKTSDELRILVASVVDDRFMQRPETRTRHRTHVFDTKSFEHVHHEVRSRAIHGKHFGSRRRISFDWRR